MDRLLRRIFMRKIFSFLFFIFIATLAALGQQDPQYTNNMFYKLGVNPGYAGSDDAISGIILNRYQWTGFGGGEPKTLVFSADAAIELFGAPGGIGLNIISDEIGFEENVLVNFNYAYKARLSFGVLGVGVSAGFFSKSINGEWEVPDDPFGIFVQPGSDPGIPQGESSQIAFDSGIGVYLKGLNYYVGASVTHVNEAGIKYADLASTYLARHYYLTGGYNMKLSDPLFEVRPSFLIKSDLAGWQIDLNANLVYNDRLWAGMTYRTKDAIALLMGIELFNGLRVGYSFDITTSAIARWGYGSHELFIGYSVDLERNRTRKYKSVRFL
jgi:type IX secretion system PorP/SprF family membrane protein